MRARFTIVSIIVAAWLTYAAVPASAQYVAVTAQMKSANGAIWANCTVNASFIPSPTATTQALINGSTFQTTVPSVKCDSSGNFTLTLVDNNLVTDGHTGPVGSQWNINVVSDSVCFAGQIFSFSDQLTITGATQNISSALTSVAPNLPTCGGGGSNFSLNSLTGAVILQGGGNTTVTTNPSTNTITATSTGGGGGGGSVTNVGLAGPVGIQITGSPVTGIGTLTFGMPTGWGTGSLLLGNGANNVTNLPIGPNGDILESNGTTASWQVPSGTLDTCMMVIGSDAMSASALATSDIQPQLSQCYEATNATVVSIIETVNSGASTVEIGFRHNGSTTDLSGLLTPAAVGGITDPIACANVGGTAIDIEGNTVTCSALVNSTLTAGDYLETIAGTADGTSTRVSIATTFLVPGSGGGGGGGGGCSPCVTSLTGDGTIVTNSGSTGAVTLTVGPETGTGNIVLATSPTLVTPALGTPSAVVLTHGTGLPLSTGVTGQLPISAVGSAGLSGTSPIAIASTGVISCTTCNTSSATIAGSIAATQVAFGASSNTIEGTANATLDGSGDLDIAGNLTVGSLSGSGARCVHVDASGLASPTSGDCGTGGSGSVTSVATSSPLGGGPITTSGTLTCTTCVVASSPGAGVAHFAGSTQTVTSSAVTPSDATGNTSGSGNFCLVTSCTMVTPALGTPSAAVLTHATGLPLSTGVTGQLPISAVGSAGLSGTSPISIASTGVISCSTCATGSITPGTTDALAAYTSSTAIGAANTPPTVNGNYWCGYQVIASAAVVPTCPLSGLTAIPLNGSTSGYSVTYAANETTILHDVSASSSITVTLPTPTTLGNTAFTFRYVNHSANNDVITPTTWQIQSGTHATSASLVVSSGWSCQVYIDQTNSNTWDADCVSLQ